MLYIETSDRIPLIAVYMLWSSCVHYLQLFPRKTQPLIPQRFVIFEWKMRHYEGKHVILRPYAEGL